MIGYIKGKITGIFPDYCFIETSGVGYMVYISDVSREELISGEETRLFTYLAVRQDALTLYGFTTTEERDLFLLLITVSGIGARVALGILSAVRPAVFSMAVRNKDKAMLTRLPGIGRKTAERLIVELADKLGQFGGDDEAEAEEAVHADAEDTGDAAAALRALGYEPAEFLPVLRKLEKQISDPAQLIREALRELGRERSAP